MKRPSLPALRFGSAAFVLVMATLFCAAGCGASSPNANFGAPKVSSSAMPGDSAPQNLDEAQAQLAAAEQHLFGVFGAEKRVAQGQFAQPPGQMPQPYPSGTAGVPVPGIVPPPPPPTMTSGYPHKEGEGKPEAADAAAGLSANPCEIACRALASMNRAATHICSLAGDDSESCTSARERVRLATERVRQSCSDCAG